jgi:hypothetical protein
MWQQFLHRLLHLRWVSPGHRLEELGKPTFVSCEVEPELPDEIFLFRIQGLAGGVVEDHLDEGRVV